MNVGGLDDLPWATVCVVLGCQSVFVLTEPPPSRLVYAHAKTTTQEQQAKAEERAVRAEAAAREARAQLEDRVAGKERELSVQEAHFAGELVRAPRRL